MEENKFYEIGLTKNSDKVHVHNYHKIYPQYIEKYYNSAGGMLEIGLSEGDSLDIWLELFPNMHIYGLDISPPELPKSDRYTIIEGDQSRPKDLVNVRDKINHPIWFINDDGSHIPEHQLLTFNLLFPLLEVGGVYIIEDIETSYWTQNGIYQYRTRYGLGHPKNIIEIFKSAADGVNHRFIKNPGPQQVMHQSQFHSITFAQNCIIIVKGKVDKKPYLYEECL